MSGASPTYRKHERSIMANFKEVSTPNVEELDKAKAKYEELCQVYDLNEITLRNSQIWKGPASKAGSYMY